MYVMPRTVYFGWICYCPGRRPARFVHTNRGGEVVGAVLHYSCKRCSCYSGRRTNQGGRCNLAVTDGVRYYELWSRVPWNAKRIFVLLSIHFVSTLTDDPVPSITYNIQHPKKLREILYWVGMGLTFWQPYFKVKLRVKRGVRAC